MAASVVPISAASGAGKGKRGQGPRKSHSIALMTIPLEQIVEHPAAAALRKTNDAYLRELPLGCITRHGLEILANHAPLHVVKHKEGEFYCIGGLRIFRLLKKALNSADEIEVIVHSNVSAELLEEHLEIDILMVPVLFGLNHKDRRILARIWDRLTGLPFSALLTKPGWKGIAHILGCELRPKKT